MGWGGDGVGWMGRVALRRQRLWRRLHACRRRRLPAWSARAGPRDQLEPRGSARASPITSPRRASPKPPALVWPACVVASTSASAPHSRNGAFRSNQLPPSGAPTPSPEHPGATDGVGLGMRAPLARRALGATVLAPIPLHQAPRRTRTTHLSPPYFARATGRPLSTMLTALVSERSRGAAARRLGHWANI